MSKVKAGIGVTGAMWRQRKGEREEEREKGVKHNCRQDGWSHTGEQGPH